MDIHVEVPLRTSTVVTAAVGVSVGVGLYGTLCSRGFMNIHTYIVILSKSSLPTTTSQMQ